MLPAEAATYVSEKPQRRKYTAEYKRRILEEADRCTKPGELGALCRREGIYQTHISRWRRERERGGPAELEPKKRGRRPSDGRDRRIAELERELAQLKTRAERAEAIVEVQKKVSELLGIKLKDDPGGKR
jgi:transposase-like protein